MICCGGEQVDRRGLLPHISSSATTQLFCAREPLQVASVLVEIENGISRQGESRQPYQAERSSHSGDSELQPHADDEVLTGGGGP